MKFQIQVRGLWGGTAGDWRPAIPAPDGNGAVASTFGSWDEAEEVLDRLQLAGLLPYSYLEPSGAELRIIELDQRARSGSTVGVVEPEGSDQRAA